LAVLRKQYQTINGELEVTLEGNLLIARFVKAVDKKIMTAFLQILKDLIATLDGQKWGYISLSQDAEAATPEAEEVLVEAMQTGWALGCVAGGYILGSNMVITQMDRVLKKAGLETGLEGKVFADLEQAKSSVSERLKAFQTV